MQLEVLTLLSAGFLQYFDYFSRFIRGWIFISYLPIWAMFTEPSISKEMPKFIYNYIVDILSLLLNRYIAIPLAIFLLFSYKFKFISEALQVLFFLPLIPFAPMLELLFLGVMWTLVNLLMMFKVTNSLYRFFRPNSNLSIEKIFTTTLSEESLLLMTLGGTLGLVYTSLIPVFITGGILASARAMNLASYAYEAIYNYFTKEKRELVYRKYELTRTNEALNTNINTLATENQNLTQQLNESASRVSLGNKLYQYRHLTHTTPDLDKVIHLLKNPQNDHLLSNNNNFYLRHAAEMGRWDIVVLLLRKPNVNFNSACEDGFVLLKAIEKNEWKIVLKLIKHPDYFTTPISEGMAKTLGKLLEATFAQEKISLLHALVHSKIYEHYALETRFMILKLAAEINDLSILKKVLHDEILVSTLSYTNLHAIFNAIKKETLETNTLLTIFDADSILIDQTKNLNFKEFMFNGVQLSHLINADDFNSPQDLVLFYTNLSAFLDLKYKEKPHIILAIELLGLKENYLEINKMLENEQIQNPESAQTPSEVLAANQMYKKIQQHYEQEFMNKKTTNISALKIIEAEIKNELLNQMLLEAQENLTKNYYNETSEQIIELIQTHKVALLSGQMDITTLLFRLIEEFIPHDVSAIQTAWLSYDPGHDVDPRNWKFLVPPTMEEIAYATIEASESSITNWTASKEIRTRIAYYWLAVNDENCPDPDNFRLGNFFGIISSIYRTYGFGESCCYPGHLSNIAKMGTNHPITESMTLDNLVEQAIISHVIGAFKAELKENLTWSIEDKENAVTSLTYVNDKNAENIIRSNSESLIDFSFQLIFTKKYFAQIMKNAFMDIIKNERFKSVYENFNNFADLIIVGKTMRTIMPILQFKLSSIGSNQVIMPALNELILNSRCIKRDIDFVSGCPFVPGNSKYKLYTELALLLNNPIKKLPYYQLPTVKTLSAIQTICQNIVIARLANGDISACFKKLEMLNLRINVDKLEKLFATKADMILGEAQPAPILNQFNATRHFQQNPTTPETRTSTRAYGPIL